MTKLLGGIVLAAAAFGAQAQGIIKPGDETWTFRLGAFLPAFKTDMQVDNETTGGSGDRVDLGDDLGVDQDTSGGWVSAEWRFAPRHRIGFNYSRFTLNGARDLSRTITVGDETFPVGAHVDSQLRLEIIPITYSYSFLKRERDELAATIGLHWSRMSFSVHGSFSAGAQDATHDSVTRADVPLPLLGLRYDHHFSERWSAGANAAAFALKFAEDTFNLDGTLWSVRVHGEYRWTRNFGVGAAIDGFRVKVDASQDRWKGGLDYGYWGPQVYLTGRF
jgi:hypothetical protein